MLVRLREVVVALVTTASMLAGCTFLIDFDAVAFPPDASAADLNGPDTAVTPDPPDVQVGSNVPEAASDAGLDVRDAIANPDACNGMPNGMYCSGNQIVWPFERKDDLVTCKDNVVSIVRPCSDLGGCVRMAAGSPDQCDECNGREKGDYCGRDVGWAPDNWERLVSCENNAAFEQPLCKFGCYSEGANSFCRDGG